jgi:hypothetical protein
MTIREQIYTVAVYDAEGQRVYLRRERAYSAGGAMTQIHQRHSYRDYEPPEPYAAWPVDNPADAAGQERVVAAGAALIAALPVPPESLLPARGLPVSHSLAYRIAEDAVGLFLEYRDKHGHSEASARASAVLEVADGASVDLGGMESEAAAEETERRT